MSGARTALVTGASRGIGRAVVTLLVREGRTVVACARDADALAELERRYPGKVVGIAADLTVSGAPVAVVAEARARVGALHELVYAAGVVHYEDVDATTEQSVRAQLELNFLAPFAMMREAGLAMRGAGGAIVVIASTLATHPAPGTAAYAASKAALIAAARTLARELAPTVRINVVSPGVVDTDMVRVARRPLAQGESTEAVITAQLDALTTLHPLGRLGRPDDVADAVRYLLDASWVTGAVLTVDGGLTV